ncbi:hypothetical protein YPPY07_1692, partial [Yersinia pestis PY-07]|jgi:hypothetical protein
MRASSN